MNPITFPKTHLKTVKADFVSGSITLTFRMGLSPAVLALRKELALMTFLGDGVELTITPITRQMSLLPDENTTATVTFPDGTALDLDKSYDAVTRTAPRSGASVGAPHEP